MPSDIILSVVTPSVVILIVVPPKKNFLFRPISKSAQNWFGLGLTIVDSLDTMLMMGLQVAKL
jgi:hypothetical protein